MRSSKSPLYFAPDSKAVKSREKINLFFKISGTRFLTKSFATPSTIAVFPTPASPIKHGLFFVFLERSCKTLSTSLSRPISGSFLLRSDVSVMFFPYLKRFGYCDGLG